MRTCQPTAKGIDKVRSISPTLRVLNLKKSSTYREMKLASKHHTPHEVEPRTPSCESSCAVVVASFRPGQLINQCLSSLLAQQGIADIQIVVVDSSADG